MNRSEVMNKLAEFKREKGEEYGILSIGIFGSFSRNQASEFSDLDVVVKTKTPDPYLIVHIKEDLEKQFSMPVDIVRFRQGMNSFLKQQIEKDAIYVQ